ncbi:MAG: ATP-binding protein [Snowella sp.]|nr:ATP-binding protein [Snowella sp.]
MTTYQSVENETINLTNCDREPIHIPGAIQPHGLLLVVLLADWQITQVSDNAEAVIGLASDAMLGQPLSLLLENEQIAAIEGCLERHFEQINPLKLSLTTANGVQPFNGIVHALDDDAIILELEPNGANHLINPLQFYQSSKKILLKLQSAANISELCEVMAKEIRQLTGFDRVMVYQFDETGAGNIVAEDRLDTLESYLGLHYPDSDIPRQAKQLYTLNLLRLIPTVDYEPIPIIALDSDRHTPLDLSFSVLRSVSPIHIEYLKNMGVSATMTISLLKEGKLWGLIACHHQTPYFIPYETRNLCEFLGQVMSLELAAKEANEDLDYKLFLKSVQAQLINTLGQAENITDALVKDRNSLLALVGAEGAAVYTEGNLVKVGNTPPEEALSDLIDWLDDKFQNDLFVTQVLPQIYPPAIAFKQVASGLLALSITKVQKNYVLWFRPEILQKVNWAGNPHKPQRIEADGSLTIFPRQSFELWQETVRLQALPWKPWEIEGAVELRSAVVGIVLRKVNELAAINLELERSNTELDAFAYLASHDLKEPLRGIHNYSTFLLEDYADVLDEEGVDKLHTLVKLTKRMEDLINALLHFSRLGRQELNFQTLDLNQSLQSIGELFTVTKKQDNIEIRIPRPLPPVLGDRVLLEEVLTNLVGNGLKYNNNAERWVEIGYLESEVSPAIASENFKFLTFYIKDNGIGIQEKHFDTIFRIFKRLHALNKYGGGTGVGLTIVKKILERHHGKIWIESVYGEGSTFYFTLPTTKL